MTWDCEESNALRPTAPLKGRGAASYVTGRFASTAEFHQRRADTNEALAVGVGASAKPALVPWSTQPTARRR